MSLWLGQFFKFMFRLPVNAFAVNKIESALYTYASRQSFPLGFYNHPQAEGNYSSSQAAFLRKSLPHSRKGEGGIYEIAIKSDKICLGLGPFVICHV